MILEYVVVLMLILEPQQCEQCKQKNKTCTVSGSGTLRHKTCNICKAVKQGFSFIEWGTRGSSSEAGSIVTLSLAERVEGMEMGSGVLTPSWSDKCKAAEVGSSPEGQPAWSWSKVDLKVEMKGGTTSRPSVMGPLWALDST